MKLLLVSLIVTLGFCCLSVQCNSALKQVVKTEGQLIDDVVRNGDETANAAKNHLDETIASSSPSVKNAFNTALKKNIDRFHKGLLDLGEDAIKEIVEMSLEELIKEQVFLYEIETNKQFEALKLAIAKKLNRPKMEWYEVRSLLVGAKVYNYKIAPEKLYRLYFRFSDSFAKEELNNLLVSNNCSDEIESIVKDLATKRNVPINQCEKEEDSIFYVILGILFLGCIAYTAIYYVWKGYKYLTALNNKN
jgi:hypothetical protein